MKRFWDILIEPLLETLQPGSIVVMGATGTPLMPQLLSCCKRIGASLYVIGLAPQDSAGALPEPDQVPYVFLPSLSPASILQPDRLAAVLIDGDHNWYTVFQQLSLIERRSVQLGQSFPLVCVSNIGWPYGRRDVYADPDSIPLQYRQPYKQWGVRPDSGELCETGGLYPDRFHSIYEHNLKNGVLTAVEDFLQETQCQLEFIRIAGFSGLGVLVPLALKERNNALARLLTTWQLPPVVERYLEQLEAERLRLEVAQVERVGEDDLEHLTDWLERLDTGIRALLTSQRWRIGNMLGEVLRRIRFKPRDPVAVDFLTDTLQKFRAWKVDHERKDASE